MDCSLMRGCCLAHTCQDVLEGELDVAGVESRRLNEGEVVVTCETIPGQYLIPLCREMVSGGILANCLASSVGTARRCLKSLLFPTSIMTMLLSA